MLIAASVIGLGSFALYPTAASAAEYGGLRRRHRPYRVQLARSLVSDSERSRASRLQYRRMQDRYRDRAWTMWGAGDRSKSDGLGRVVPRRARRCGTRCDGDLSTLQCWSMQGA